MGALSDCGENMAQSIRLFQHGLKRVKMELQVPNSLSHFVRKFSMLGLSNSISSSSNLDICLVFTR